MPKTNFVDRDLSQGIPGTIVTAEFLSKINNQVPTGEDRDGSAPVLYGNDTGVADAYALDLVFGLTREEGANTSVSANKLVDTGATFITKGVEIGDVVLNASDLTSAKVTAVDSETLLSLDADIFTATPKNYAVGPHIFQAPGAYVEGLRICFKAANANTGASTLNINGLGVKTIKKNINQDLISGDIQVGQIVMAQYDGVNFQLIGGILDTFISDSLWHSINPRLQSMSGLSTSYASAGVGAGFSNLTLELTTGNTAGNYQYHHYSGNFPIVAGKRISIEWILKAVTNYGESLLHITTHSGSAPPPETAHHLGFKIISGTGQIWASNADGTTQKSTDTGVAMPASPGRASLKAVLTPGTDIKFYVNNVLKAVHTTNLPTSLFHLMWGVKTPDAVDRAVRVDAINIKMEP